MAQGVWYAQIQGGRFAQCLHWGDLDLDGAHKFLETQFGARCSVDGSKRWYYVFRCGTDNNQIISRTKKGCLLIRDVIAGRAKAPGLYAPTEIVGREARERWIVGFNSCFRKAYLSIGIETAERYCDCIAHKIATHPKYATLPEASQVDMLAKWAVNCGMAIRRQPETN